MVNHKNKQKIEKDHSVQDLFAFKDVFPIKSFSLVMISRFGDIQ